MCGHVKQAEAEKGGENEEHGLRQKACSIGKERKKKKTGGREEKEDRKRGQTQEGGTAGQELVKIMEKNLSDQHFLVDYEF